MKQIKVLTLGDFTAIVDDADKPETVAAVIVLLLAQWKKKQSSFPVVAAVLRKCADWVESHT